MRGNRTIWIAVGLGVLLAGATASVTAMGSLGGTLAPGSTHYVRVADSDRSGVLAGIVAQSSEGPLGLTEETTAASEGWVVAHPKGHPVEGPVSSVEETTFTDPNGATWTVHELETEHGTAWAVEVQEPLHDDALDGKYNYAIVVDWSQVPDGGQLDVSYSPSLALT